jgi:PIN domain nuclease of toxin-antitoxin system
MKYILDTHVLLWLLTNPKELSDNVKSIIENPKNEITVSAISFWEISLKFSIGKLTLENFIPEDFYQASVKMGFNLIPIKPEVTQSFHHLNSFYQRDPFDRMLIWQAITENYTLITKDSTINLYKTEGLKTIW